MEVIVPFTFEIQFSNFSSQTLELGSFGFSQSGKDNGGLQTTPANSLMSGAGLQSVSAYAAALNSIAEGSLDLWCTWLLPPQTTPLRFGVKLHFPTQVFTVGSDPYWYIMYDQLGSPGSGDPSPDWIRSGKHPGDTFSWPETLPLQIVATPQASGTGLTVQVAITDPTST